MRPALCRSLAAPVSLLTTSTLDIIPIGGAGQFGMNCTLLVAEDASLLVDAGLRFPTGEKWGIDALVPDIAGALAQGSEPAAIVLTHGHEDHIGAVPTIAGDLTCPIYGSDLTLSLLAPKLREHAPGAIPRLVRVRARDRIQAGPFTIEFVHVTHSVPGSFALAIDTPAGRIVHSADFKLDPTPVDGRPTDIDRLAELGREGVRVLLMDSTNAEREGVTPSERSIAAPAGRLVDNARGRVFVTTFSSHIHRIQQFVDIAARCGRKVAFAGRRMQASVQAARETGDLRFPPESAATIEEVMEIEPRRGLVVAGGSQGEPLSAMTRIAAGRHPDARLAPDDLVVHSARAVPGNEVPIGRVFDDIARRRAAMVGGEGAGVHVSGHGSADDLRTLLALLRPGIVVPIHGAFRHLAAAARIAESAAAGPREVLIVENGAIIRIDGAGVRIAGSMDARPIFLDRTYGRVGEEALRERRRLGTDGLVLPIVVLDRSTGGFLSGPELVLSGFSSGGGAKDLLEDGARLLARRLRDTVAPDASEDALAAAAKEEVKRYFKRRTGKRPLVAPIIVRI